MISACENAMQVMVKRQPGTARRCSGVLPGNAIAMLGVDIWQTDGFAILAGWSGRAR
jgi:hypothetical protein